MDDAREALKKLLDGLSDSEAKEALEKLTDIPAAHQLVRMMLAAAASGVVGKVVGNIYTAYVKSRK